MKNKKIFILFFYPALLALNMLALQVSGQQFKINSGAYVNNNGNAYILINNVGLVNNGTYAKAAETVTFSGNTARTISGSSNTSMNDLSVTNTGGITAQSGLLTINDLTVASGCKFTIDAPKVVTVTGSITNSAGNDGLVLKSDATGTASLIHNTDNIAATVERYISGAAEDWHFISSPVAAQEFSGSWITSGTYGNGTGYDLYLWNEPNSCWIYSLDYTSPINWNTVHPESSFVPGRGYLYSVQAANPTKEFVGNLNNGSLTYGLTFSSADAGLKGFNLVGNPYPSSIDWRAATGWTRTVLKNSGGGYDMWIWNPSVSNYGVYNSADASGTGTNSVTRYIASTQGYFVQAASTGNLGMDNNVRDLTGDGNLFKSASQDAGKVSLRVKSDAGYGSDEILLLFGYPENENGAMKLFSKVITAPSLCISSEENNLSVRYFTDTENNPAVPVMFTPGINGNYSISCNFDQDIFETVMLEDRQMHYIQNMKAGKTYSFNASKTDDANRFVLYFSPISNHADGVLPARIYSDGSSLIVDLTLISEDTDFLVYDIMGRILIQQELQGEIQHYLDINATEQILIVYLKNPNGSLCRKIFWVVN